MLTEKDKFLLQLNGPEGRATIIKRLVAEEKEYTDAIAWVITSGLKDHIPAEFENLDIGEHSYIVLDGACKKSYYGLHEVEINPQRLVYPPKTLRCRFCDDEVDITDNNTWRFPYNP